MADPYAIFREARTGQQEMLKTVWHELYAALAQLDDPLRGRSPGRCPMCPPTAAPGTMTGRITLNGVPACASCLDRLSDRRGGYPLAIVDRNAWKG